MSEQAKESSATLKTIYSSLQKVYTILNTPRDKLDFVLSGSTPKDADSSASDIGNITFDMIITKIHQIELASSEISKMTSKLVGN